MKKTWRIEDDLSSVKFTVLCIMLFSIIILLAVTVYNSRYNDALTYFDGKNRGDILYIRDFYNSNIGSRIIVMSDNSEKETQSVAGYKKERNIKLTSNSLMEKTDIDLEKIKEGIIRLNKYLEIKNINKNELSGEEIVSLIINFTRNPKELGLVSEMEWTVLGEKRSNFSRWAERIFAEQLKQGSKIILAANKSEENQKHNLIMQESKNKIDFKKFLIV